MLTALADVKYGCCQMLDGLISTHLKIMTCEWFSCMFEKNLAYGRPPEAIKPLLTKSCTLLKQKMQGIPNNGCLC